MMRGLLSVVVCLMIVAELSASKITSVKFDKMETFASGLYNTINHIEQDRYKVDGSLLFCERYSMKTTDGKTTELIAGSGNSTYGYQDGKGSKARFLYIRGFKQLNSSSVAIADSTAACIRMLDRVTQKTSCIAGVCKSKGFINGKSGKFNNPWSVEVFPGEPDKLLVTDYGNSALRSVDIPTGYVDTVIKSGLTNPRGMAWNIETTSLFITNAHYIAEVKFGVNGTVISNINIAGSTSFGFSEGLFRSVRFYTPIEITPVRRGLQLIADQGNTKLRVIDTMGNRTVPVCYSSDASCKALSIFPNSILAVGQTVYIGQKEKIFKLSGYKCWTESVTVYIPAHKNTVNVQIYGSYSGDFPVGRYEFKAPLGGDVCSYYINVKDGTSQVNKSSVQIPNTTSKPASPVVRTLSFQSKYDVKCASVDNHISKAFLESVLAQRAAQLLKVCGTYCKMSQRMKPFYTCQNDVMTVTWPTNQVYAYDVTYAPEGFGFRIRENLKKASLVDTVLVILSHNPPLVMPKKNADGATVTAVVYSSCEDKSKTYQKSNDKCV